MSSRDEAMFLNCPKIWDSPKIRESNPNSYDHPRTSDLITGANRFKLRDKFLKNKKGYVDKHGLIKTIYTSFCSRNRTSKR